MAVICPTVTTDEVHEYRQQIERVLPFANRIHVDLADGQLTSNRLMELDKVWLPDEVVCDIHLMYKHPEEALSKLIELKPSLVVMHAEAEGNFIEMADRLHQAGIKVGIALLAQTGVDSLAAVLEDIDHVLIFSGELGHFGGHADLGLLSKAKELKALKPSIEIGWDGGIDEHNVRQLAEAGVDVLNTGGFIQKAEHPAGAYAKLEELIKGL